MFGIDVPRQPVAGPSRDQIEPNSMRVMLLGLLLVDLRAAILEDPAAAIEKIDDALERLDELSR